MQKTFLVQLLLVSMYISTSLMSSSPLETASNEQQLIPKNDVAVLKSHGTLSFTFTPNFSALAKGEWRLLVITPDKKTFKGPKITIPTSPASPITFAVKHPIFFGLYTIATENINVTNFLSSTPDLIDGFVTITNSFNSKSIDVAITSAVTNNPGTIQEGYFTPFHPFIPH